MCEMDGWMMEGWKKGVCMCMARSFVLIIMV